MIGKLKWRFTLLATASMLVLMVVLLLIMNLFNLSSVISESDTILDVLSRTDSPFSEPRLNPVKPPDNIDDFIPRGMSPEVPYESRYFSVTVNTSGEITESDLSRIISVDDESVLDYVQQATETDSSRGFAGHFRFKKTESNRIIFLDCGRKLDAFYTFLWGSVGAGILGCLLVFLIFLFAAGRIIKPIAESYEKQKRFISDAGHEIKTPLTIINANVDLLECDGEREELTDIRQQTGRLTRLTDSLVFLSRMEEENQGIQTVAFPLSDLVTETASSFQAPARAHSIALTLRIAPDISLVGSPDNIRRLVSVLTDNAIKYAPEGGMVVLELGRHRRGIIFSVFNTTREEIRQAEIPRVFDRFYRTDSSRSSRTGGHGIGLSIARAIVEAHHGSITASTKTGFDFTVTVFLPA